MTHEQQQEAREGGRKRVDGMAPSYKKYIGTLLNDRGNCCTGANNNDDDNKLGGGGGDNADTDDDDRS